MRQLAGRCKKGHPPPGCPVDTVAARTCVHTPSRDSNSMRRTTSPCRMSCRNGPLANLQSMPRDHFKCFESKGERRGAGISRYRRECEPSEDASNSKKTSRSEEFRETFHAQPVTNRRSRARDKKSSSSVFQKRSRFIMSGFPFRSRVRLQGRRMSWISRGEHEVRPVSGKKIVRRIRFNACSPVLGHPGSLALVVDDWGDGSMKQVPEAASCLRGDRDTSGLVPHVAEGSRRARNESSPNHL